MKKRLIFTVLYSFSIYSANALILVGHRGVSGPAPEHTLKAFTLAIEKYNVDAVEFDIRACKDNLVIINSDDLSATANGTGLVKHKTVEELKKLSVGSHEEKIPTLNETLECINRRVQIMIEIKEPETVDDIAKMIQSYCAQHDWPLSNVYVSSLHHPSLIAFKKLCPEVKLAPCLIGTPATYAQFAQEMNAYGLCTTPDSITQEYVDDAHKRGLKIFVGGATLNNAKRATEIAQKMIAMRVDGLVLNDPGILP